MRLDCHLSARITISSRTSASTAVFAALVSLVNYERANRGMGPVGFLNPLLYKHAAQMAHDITSGSNYCSAGYTQSSSHNATLTCCNQGYHSAKGWDPVTGLGSVDFAKMLQVLATPMHMEQTEDVLLLHRLPPTMVATM